VTHGAMPIER
jgi:hypothetical protein